MGCGPLGDRDGKSPAGAGVGGRGKFAIGAPAGVRAAVIFIDGLVEKTAVNESIIYRLMVATRLFEPRWRIPPKETFCQSREHLVSVGDVRETETLSGVIDGSKTCVCLVHIKGIANDKIVEEVKRSPSNINIDAILDSGYIEEFMMVAFIRRRD